jgi:hypothetical protein
MRRVGHVRDSSVAGNYDLEASHFPRCHTGSAIQHVELLTRSAACAIVCTVLGLVAATLTVGLGIAA